MRASWAGAALVVLAGCAMGPEYKRPDTPAAAQQSFRGQAADAKSLGDLPFWEVFHDEALKALIEESLAKSPTVQIAAARVEQARALARADGWSLWPAVNTNASGGRQRAVVPGGPVVATFNSFGVGAAVSWEVDIWGRLRRTGEASYQAFLASEEAQRGVTVALVGDVATTYFQLRALDAQRTIAEQRIASRTRALQLFQARLDRGTGNRAEVATATAQVMDAQAQLADIERRRRLAQNQLSVLTGSPPRELKRGETLEAQVMPEVPAGLPSALLERRPDLRLAEAQLHAETARIGAAVANLFPKLSLTAALGLASPSLGALLSGHELNWSYGGALGWLAPFLGREQLLAAVDMQKGRTAEVTAVYFQAALTALREVDDALSALELIGKQVTAIEAQVKAVTEQRALAESRYQSGVTSFLEVTTAEEAVLPAQLSLENARAARLSALVSLYRALGGGWKTPAATTKDEH